MTGRLLRYVRNRPSGRVYRKLSRCQQTNL